MLLPRPARSRVSDLRIRRNGGGSISRQLPGVTVWDSQRQFFDFKGFGSEPFKASVFKRRCPSMAVDAVGSRRKASSCGCSSPIAVDSAGLISMVDPAFQSFRISNFSSFSNAPIPRQVSIDG
jgi:hypothetical protein